MSRDGLRRVLLEASEQKSLMDSLLALMAREIKKRFDPSKWTVERFIDWLIRRFKSEIPLFASIDDLRSTLRKFFPRN